MNLSKTNADVFTSIILRRSYWNLLRFLCLYLCNHFLFFKHAENEKVNVKNTTRIKSIKNVFYMYVLRVRGRAIQYFLPCVMWS